MRESAKFAGPACKKMSRKTASDFLSYRKDDEAVLENPTLPAVFIHLEILPTHCP